MRTSARQIEHSSKYNPAPDLMGEKEIMPVASVSIDMGKVFQELTERCK